MKGPCFTVVKRCPPPTGFESGPLSEQASCSDKGNVFYICFCDSYLFGIFIYNSIY